LAYAIFCTELFTHENCTIAHFLIRDGLMDSFGQVFRSQA
jgi:hypothetical protein